METVYFESSVFLAVLNGEETGPKIRELLRELKRSKVRIYTSIITLQEISVLSYRRGTVADDMVGKLDKLTRVVGVTKDMALTAAKLEAQIKDLGKAKTDEQIAENRRRKWDCFHIASAMCLKAATVYSLDGAFLRRKDQLGIVGLEFSPPVPREPTLDFLPAPEEPRGGAHAQSNEKQPPTDTQPAELRGGGDRSPEDQAGAEAAQAAKASEGEGDGEEGQREGQKSRTARQREANQP